MGLLISSATQQKNVPKVPEAVRKTSSSSVRAAALPLTILRAVFSRRARRSRTETDPRESRNRIIARVSYRAGIKESSRARGARGVAAGTAQDECPNALHELT